MQVSASMPGCDKGISADNCCCSWRLRSSPKPTQTMKSGTKKAPPPTPAEAAKEATCKGIGCERTGEGGISPVSYEHAACAGSNGWVHTAVCVLHMLLSCVIVQRLAEVTH
jgi:hypothetical protein